MVKTGKVVGKKLLWIEAVVSTEIRGVRKNRVCDFVHTNNVWDVQVMGVESNRRYGFVHIADKFINGCWVA